MWLPGLTLDGARNGKVMKVRKMVVPFSDLWRPRCPPPPFRGVQGVISRPPAFGVQGGPTLRPSATKVAPHLGLWCSGWSCSWVLCVRGVLALRPSALGVVLLSRLRWSGWPQSRVLGVQRNLAPGHRALVKAFARALARALAKVFAGGFATALAKALGRALARALA